MLIRRIAGAITLAILMFSVLAGQAAAQPPALPLEVNSAILIDHASGQVLFEQDPDMVVAPASLTKLMTLHLAYKHLAEGKMKREDPVNISTNAWAQNPALRGSSLMFLEPGMKVTVQEILEGIGIPSGNDACIAMAEHIAGSVQAFVAIMNEEARALGYKTMVFHDPHGLSNESQVTAREMVHFARFYIQAHPESLQELHSQKEYQFPKWENLTAERQQAIGSKERFQPPDPQYNRNLLLWSFAGADGLKTGFIDESGYHLVSTAEREGMRLIGAVMGANSEAHREEQALALMTWGYRNWVLVRPEKVWEQAPPIRVWKGAGEAVTAVPNEEIVFVVPAGEKEQVEHKIDLPEQAVAPIAKGSKLGTLTFTVEGKTVFSTDLVAAEEVPAGGFFKRLWDGLRLWVAGLLKR